MVLNPLDGRYKQGLTELHSFIGEDSLILNRIKAECLYLLALSAADIFKLSAREKQNIKTFSEPDLTAAQTVKLIETQGYKNIKPTRHDVKAVEYYLKDLFAQHGMADKACLLHFALTSEDINSLCYALMIRDSLEYCLLPALKDLLCLINQFSADYADDVLLARTHGQAAVPTTFGKEFKVFYYRLNRQINHLKKQKISCKFGGAVGCYNAHYAAFPKVDWQEFSQNFIESFNKGRNCKIFLWEVSTQIDPHDTYAELFDNLRRINRILADFAQDIWLYISRGLIKQKTVEGEVGSSTMPQKVNPIDFENAEGNLGLADALFEFFSRKLTVSRLQRDLSDSTVLRNIGSAFGYCLTAYGSVKKGLGRIRPDTAAAQKEVSEHPEVLAEALQTLLRAWGKADAYEKLKTFTRGKKITQKDLENFIKSLKLNKTQQKILLNLKPLDYTGLAAKTARKVYL